MFPRLFPRWFFLLSMVAGLAFGGVAMAQGNAAPPGAVVKDPVGALTVQVGSNPPQPYKPGTAVPVGAILSTGANSSVTLVFPDGQICALGPNTTFRMASYAYDSANPGKGEMALNILAGSVRLVAGAIAQANPAGVRMQAGVMSVTLDSAAPRADASFIVQGGQVAVASTQGTLGAQFPSGQRQAVAPGQALALGADGRVQSGTLAQASQQLGPQMDQTFAALAAMTGGINQILATLANPSAAQQLFAQLDQLPPPGAIQSDPPPPVFSASGTPGTGASSGGSPCAVASCN